MSVFTGGPYGRLAVMLNTLSSLNIEIIIIIIMNKSLHTQRTAYVSPPIHYIHLYKSLHRISPLRCELQILTRLFTGALYLEAEI